MISGVSRTYDELEVGAVYRSRFGRTVLEADNVWFTPVVRTGIELRPARRRLRRLASATE
jgi:hypothetical protein